MTFKTGDKVKAEGYSGVWTILMLDGNDTWCKKDSGEHLTFRSSMLKKLPDFFEAGKTYKNNSWDATFDCHYVGWIGSASAGHKYAAGQYDGQGVYGETIRDQGDFREWTEI